MPELRDSKPPAQAPEKPGRTFLVLEKNPIIAADLIGTLEAASQCDVIHIEDPAQAADALVGVTTIFAAFVEMKPEIFSSSELHPLLETRGAHLIFTMGETIMMGKAPAGATLLLRPFTEQMIVQAVLDAEH